MLQWLETPPPTAITADPLQWFETPTVIAVDPLLWLETPAVIADP